MLDGKLIQSSNVTAPRLRQALNDHQRKEIGAKARITADRHASGCRAALKGCAKRAFGLGRRPNGLPSI